MEDYSHACVADGDDTLVSVRVVPRAAKTALAGRYADMVKLRVAAPPLDGRANDEATDFLAGVLEVPRRHVRVQRGERSRTKVVRVAGLDVAAVAARLAAAGGGRSSG